MTEQHCKSTCQLHENAQETLKRHDKVLYGCDSDGGLVADVKEIKSTLTTVRNAMYALIGIVCVTVVGSLLKTILFHIN